MYFIGTDNENRVTAHLEADENPDVNLWIESPWDIPPKDFDDWLYIDGELIHDPRDLPPVSYSAQEVLAALFEAEPTLLEELPDTTLEHMAAYMGEWELATDYRIGDLRRYNERPYRCLQNHTSQTGWEPDIAVSLWARVLSGGDEVPVWEQPQSTNPYMKGDRVHYPDKQSPIFVSTIDYNVYAPDVYGWTLEGGE